jgi:MoaA/NifB/PqqE/SkfB family radical SAM enzyme
MDFELIERIASQIPTGVTVQLHNNGEPLLHPYFKEAALMFNHCFTTFDTNGKLLLAKSAEIIEIVDSIAVSVIENDPEADEQYDLLKLFLKEKGDRKPLVVVRLNGVVNSLRYKNLGIPVATRALHSPMGSFDYQSKRVTVPETGVCLDLMHRMSICRTGEVSICVRLDPYHKGVIGNANHQSLSDIWNCTRRRAWIEAHTRGRRNVVPLCSTCEYWGLPTPK